jgi:hypothetical protein
MNGLARKYRNVSGTILVINDMNYLEIGINAVVDLSLYSEDTLRKSRGIIEQIALNNLVPDHVSSPTMVVSQGYTSADNEVDEYFIQHLADEVSKKMHKPIDMDMITAIATAIGQEISKNINSKEDMPKEQDLVDKIGNILDHTDAAVKTENQYEKDMMAASIDRMQSALEQKFPQVNESPPANEETFQSDDVDPSELKRLLNKSGGKENAK